MNKKSSPSSPASLRRKAKKKLAEQPQRLSELSARDMKHLITELSTHQIELEMQNEELRRTQLELEQSRNVYAELYDFAPVGYFTLDARGMIRDVNRTGAELLGLDKRRLRGRSFAGFLSGPEDLRAFRAHLKSVFLTQTRQACDVRLKRAKSPPLYAQLQSTAAENIDGKAGSIRMAVMDITDRRLAEEALAENEYRYRSLFNGMTEGFALHEILYDEKGEPADCRFLEVNPAFEQMTGLKRGSLIGKTKRGVFPGDDPSWIRKYGAVALTGIPAHFERWSAMLKKHYDVYAYCPAPRRVAALFLDITDRKRAESELRASEAQLKKAYAELEAVNRELEAFSYAVASDLKAPLRSIEGFSRALLEDYAGQLDDAGRDYCGRIQAATLRMTQLIEALWTMSRLTRGELSENVVDLSAEAHLIARELKKRQPERRVEFIIAEGVKVKGDADMMQVALENLLDNAWKFTAKHPSAKIEFGVITDFGFRNSDFGIEDQKTGQQSDTSQSAIQNPKSEIVYFVRDDGAGFPMEYADRLFQPFHRLHTDAEFPGIGIGLAIAHTIIKRHGGRMWAEAGVEKGATFYFTL